MVAQSALTKAAKNVQVKTATVTEAIGTTQTTVFVLPKDAFILYFTVTGPDEATQTIDIGTTADDDFYVAAGTLATQPTLFSGDLGANYQPILANDTAITVNFSGTPAAGTYRVNCFFFVGNRGND